MSGYHQTYLPAQLSFQKALKKLRGKFKAANRGDKLPIYRLAYLCLEGFRNMEPKHIDKSLAGYRLDRAKGDELRKIKNLDYVVTVNLPIEAADLARHIKARMYHDFSRDYTMRDIVIAALILGFDLNTKQITMLLEAYRADPV